MSDPLIMSRTASLIGSTLFLLAGSAAADQRSGRAARELAAEVSQKGWIVYSARTKTGDWDLFLMRPDGSRRRNITNTPKSNEAAARFSNDGKRLLFRRLKRDSQISHSNHGQQGRLVIAQADGTNPVAYGKEGQFPWACWGPNDQRLACLTPRGIEIIDIASKRVLRKLNRQRMFQRFFWSPDGKWFVGTANSFGSGWTIVRMNAISGAVNMVHQGYCCTGSWLPDSKRVIYAHRPNVPGIYRETQLWMADGDGRNRQLIYGADARHMYYGTVSPDLWYVVLTDSPKDGGGATADGSPLVVMRLSDAPTIAGPSPLLRKRSLPLSKSSRDKNGPVLRLSPGWNPHWTYAKTGGE